MKKLNIFKRIAADPSQMNEDQLEIYYAMLESVGSFRVGIEQLEQTKSNNWQIRELNELFTNMENVISESVPGKGGTTSGTILTAIEPVEDYIFGISASLKNIDYYELQKVQISLDTMYVALDSLKSMTTTYYPEVSEEQPASEPTEPTTPEVNEAEVTEAIQILENKEEEAKNTINVTVDSDIPKEEKKRTIDKSLNEVAYAAVYGVIQNFKSHGHTDLSTNDEAREQCYQVVLTSFFELVNESALKSYLNKDTLKADARYVSDYFFNQLSNTLVEWG